MHDPMCVAFKVKYPIPKRVYASRNAPRWQLSRRRRTNPENLGEPVWPWWRPTGYNLHAFGHRWGWRTLATVWHVEPNGADAGEVCKHWRDGKPNHRWRWHVRHWRVQVKPWLSIRRRFDRCGECNRRMNKASRHGYMGGDAVYHRECIALRNLRHQRDDADAFIDHLFNAYRVSADLDIEDAVGRLSPHGATNIWRERYRMQKRLGWDHDKYGQFVRSTS
jgi:hypothetical protein